VFLVFGNRGAVLRLGALVYLANAIISAMGDGWHSVSWMGWVMMAAGFLALSFAEEDSQPRVFKWRSPAWSIGFAAIVFGIGLLVYGLRHWRPF
jgi:hypothetical protein